MSIYIKKTEEKRRIFVNIHKKNPPGKRRNLCQSTHKKKKSGKRRNCSSHLHIIKTIFQIPRGFICLFLRLYFLGM